MESTISLPKQLQHPGYTTVDKALGCVYSSCTLFAKCLFHLQFTYKKKVHKVLWYLFSCIPGGSNNIYYSATLTFVHVVDASAVDASAVGEVDPVVGDNEQKRMPVQCRIL